MQFLNQECEGLVLDNGQGEYVVKGKLKNMSTSKILFIAPNSPTLINSYSGAGLPYPSAKVAFENTPNRGVVIAKSNGEFQFKIRYPNSYYQNLGTELISPHVYIKLCNEDKIHSIKLGEGLPFTSLGPSKERIIKNKKIMSQEQILLNNGY